MHKNIKLILSGGVIVTTCHVNLSVINSFTSSHIIRGIKPIYAVIKAGRRKQDMCAGQLREIDMS